MRFVAAEKDCTTPLTSGVYAQPLCGAGGALAPVGAAPGARVTGTGRAASAAVRTRAERGDSLAGDAVTRPGVAAPASRRGAANRARDGAGRRKEWERSMGLFPGGPNKGR